jgi:hypothetical protein
VKAWAKTPTGDTKFWADLGACGANGVRASARVGHAENCDPFDRVEMEMTRETLRDGVDQRCLPMLSGLACLNDLSKIN